MTTTNVTLIDKVGRTMTIRACKDAEAVRYAERYLNKEAVNRDWVEPYTITKTKMKPKKI